MNTTTQSHSKGRAAESMEQHGSGPYWYRTKPLNESSAKYGNCEVCGKPVDAVYIQVEGRMAKHEGMEPFLTHHECKETLFGHKECLLAQQR